MEYYLRLTSLCNVDCIFCETRFNKIKFDLDKHILLIYSLKLKGYRKLVISWWEPTIYFKELIFLAKYAKKLWLKVSLNTNAFSSSIKILAKQISKIKFSEIMISFHSHVEKDFDYITQRKWSYRKIISWINNLIDYWNNISLNIVCNKINKNYINNVLDFINKKFSEINTVCISPINIIKEKNKNDLSLRKQDLYNIIKSCWNNNYKFKVFKNYFAIPYCIYDRNDLYSLELENNIYFNNEELYWENIKLKECNSFIYNFKCFWINKLYYDKYWSNEFKSIK